MYYLDFFAQPPQYSIFQKEKNKTYFGGVLFLIYIIVMIFISLLYFLDFIINDKYEIEYLTIDSLFNSRSDYERNELKFDQDVNQLVKLRVRLSINYKRYIDDENVDIDEFISNIYMKIGTKIYKGSFCDNLECPDNKGDESFINFDINTTSYNRESLILYFKCKDDYCSNFNYSLLQSLYLMTANFEIIHNASDPIKVNDECFNNYLVHEICNNYKMIEDFHEGYYIVVESLFSTIIYEEKKGISRTLDHILGKENKKVFAYLDQEHTYYHNEELVNKNDEDQHFENEKEYFSQRNKHNLIRGENGDYAPLELVEIRVNPNSVFQKYRRSEIGFLTVLANIGALFSTFKVVLAIVFSFYSKNFDNYKIIEKIFQQELNNDHINKIKINNFKDFEMYQVNTEKENKNEPLISSLSEMEHIDKNIIGSNNELIENKKEDKTIKDYAKEGNGRILPKLKFFDFFFNNIYFNFCKRREKQEIIALCNNIVANYISIDSVLYNHLKLENLFKDYKWNNPGLNDITKNNYIVDLLKHL